MTITQGVKKGMKKVLESAGGGEKGKPHSTSAGRIAAGGRRLKRGFRKIKKGAKEVAKPFVKEAVTLEKLRKKKAKGGRAGFKHGDWVKTPVPHADIAKYVDRLSGKEDTRGKRSRKEGSTLEFKKPTQSRGLLSGREGGKRAKLRGGGRTNLLEELGRVEGEHSNRNRRAEVSRIHGELNKGYKSGGAVLKGKKVGCQIK